MALADTLKTDMGKPPVTPKAAAPQPQPDAAAGVDIRKMLETSKVPYGKETGQVLAAKQAADKKVSEDKAKITEKLAPYLAERRGEMRADIEPLQKQLEF